MSSLAASRADGYYYPPNYDPEKHGSLNQFRGQHPLRERAKKLDQGILVIRFEMPFNVWCGGCNHLIGKGVRFNAEKQQVGAYHSTKIWSFRMKAPCCGQRLEVQTDPKNTEYVVVSGGRRKAETWTAESAQTIELPDRDDSEAAFAAAQDPFARLERGEGDKTRGRELGARMAELYHDSSRRFKNDFELNRALRRQNREARKGEQAREGKRKALGLSDDVTLLPEAPEDAEAAALVQFGDGEAYAKKWRSKRRAIKRECIFAPSALTPAGRAAHGPEAAAGGAAAGAVPPAAAPAAREQEGREAGGAEAQRTIRPPLPRPPGRQAQGLGGGGGGSARGSGGAANALGVRKQTMKRSLADKAAAAAQRQQGGPRFRFQ